MIVILLAVIGAVIRGGDRPRKRNGETARILLNTPVGFLHGLIIVGMILTASGPSS